MPPSVFWEVLPWGMTLFLGVLCVGLIQTRPKRISLRFLPEGLRTLFLSQAMKLPTDWNQFIHQAEQALLARTEEFQSNVDEIRRQVRKAEERERTIQMQNDLLTQLLEALPLGIQAKDPNRQFQYFLWNKAMEDILELNRGKVLGKTDDDLWPKHKAQAIHLMDQQCLRRGKAQRSIQTETTQSGLEVILEVCKVPVMDGLGRQVSLLEIVEDVTEKTRQEEASQNQTENLRLVIENSSNGILVVAGGMVLFANKKAVSFTDVEEHQIQGQLFHLVFPELSLQVERAEADLLLGGQEQIFVYQSQYSHGHSNALFVEAHIKGILYQNQPALLINCQDVSRARLLQQRLEEEQRNLEAQVFERTKLLTSTNRKLETEIQDRKLLSQELEHQNQRYSSLIQSIPMAVLKLNLEGRVELSNSAWEALSGFSRDQTRHRFPADLVAQGLEEEKGLGILQQLLAQTCEPVFLKLDLIHAQGHKLRVGLVWAYERGPDRSITGLIALLSDITEQEKQQQEKRRLLSAMEQSHDAITILDTQGLITSVNPAFTRIFGLREEQALGVSFFNLFPEKREEMRRIAANVLQGQDWSGRQPAQKRGGDAFLSMVALSALLGPLGQVQGILAISRDVSKEVELEKVVQHNSRMEAIGTLAGGIAHDFNNLLFSMLLNLKLLIEDLPPRETDLAETAQDIEEAAKRAKELVNQILVFSRQSGEEFSQVDILPLVRETTRFLRSTLPANISIHHHCELEHATTWGNATKIHQVLMNLGSNAGYAMKPKGGKLEIFCQGLDLGEDKAHSLGLEPGPYLEIKVKDQGAGIAKEIQPRIFDPFFSTKPLGEGTGMGLSVVHGILASHGGGIFCESELNQGTCMTFYLPWQQNLVHSLAEPRPEPQVQGIRLMLVEDEPLVADSAQRLLERRGVQVTTFHDPRQALVWAKEHYHQVDLVLSDLNMPHLSGLELAEALKALDAKKPFVLISGFSYTEALSNSALDLVDEKLEKPLLSEQLLDCLARLGPGGQEQKS